MEELGEHHRTIHGDNVQDQFNLQCNKCENDSPIYEILTKHKKAQHATILTCHLCSFTTEMEAVLDNHEKNAHRQKYFDCEHSTKYFTNLERLEEHKKLNYISLRLHLKRAINGSFTNQLREIQIVL